MINFVHFSYVPNTATTNRIIAYLRNIPSSIKVRVFFIMPDPDFSKINDLPNNVEVIYCWDRFVSKSKLFKYFEFHRALRYIKRTLREGDCVYCYNAPLFMLELKKKGVRYFAEKTEHPEVITPESRLIKYNLKEHIELCKQLDGLFVISTALKDFYILNGVAEDKITIVNMFVDVKRFEGVSKSKVAEKYIAYCGNASNTKDGVDRLIESFAKICDLHSNLKLYIIGKAPNSGIYNANLQLSKKLGIAERVVFTGLIPMEKMPQILMDASVLVLNRPNSLQALCGFPTKLGEYLMTGNPVVVTNVGDIPLFLKDGESAMLATNNDVDDFSSKLHWLLTNLKEASQIGQKGKAVAIEYFNATNETNKLLNVLTGKYDNVLRKHC